MSQKSPRLTSREIIKQLKKHGFIEISQTGSHLKLFNSVTQKTAIVPIKEMGTVIKGINVALQF
jgi:predicted RNA binding protein YcfA (HicA-like mRNA interferase family)